MVGGQHGGMEGAERGRHGASKSPLPGKHAQAAGRQRWVVDTGASSHVVPHHAAGALVRPMSTKVETANGVVPAAGVATVTVPALGHVVEALVLQHSPCLLSAGALVRSGYAVY